MLVEGVGDLFSLKRYESWRSSTLTKGYVEELINRKIVVASTLFNYSEIENTASIPKNIVILLCFLLLLS